MDPNEAYRLLCKAIAALRDGATDEAAANEVVDRWDDLNGWMCKSGFPPVAWNNPATPKLVIPVTETGDVIGGRWTTPMPEHMRPIRGHHKLCSLLVFGGACDCAGTDS